MNAVEQQNCLFITDIKAHLYRIKDILRKVAQCCATLLSFREIPGHGEMAIVAERRDHLITLTV